MRITYDLETDTLSIRFKDVHVSESDELQEGVIADYDAERKIIGLEILDASERISEPQNLTFQSMGYTDSKPGNA